jgi:capsular exopolysaccharide synthesis family protein
MDLWGYLRAIRKYWWIVAVAVALGVGAAVIVTVNTSPRYESTVTFFVNTPSDTIAGVAQGDTFGQKRVNTYVQLIKTDRLTSRVAKDINNDMTAEQIGATISAAGDLNTVLLTATITDTSPARSLQIATSISTQFVELVSEVESGASGTAPAVRLDVVNGPTLNPTAVAPEPIRNIGLGLVLGLLLGIGLAVLRDTMDKSVRSVDDVQDAAGAPVIAAIPFDEEAKKSPLILDSHTKSIRAEAFRQLRTNLQFIEAAKPIKVIVLTSSVSEEGKSSTAANVAVTFAEANFRVLLIEGDLRRPRVADYLGLEGSLGLTNVLAGQVALGDVLQRWGRGGLTVLASGSVPPNPSELLGGDSMARLMKTLRDSFDMIIIDTPPLLPVTDGAILAAAADGAVMVVRHGSTTKIQVATAVRSLTAVDARLLGCVLNMVPTKGVDAYGYGSAYYEDHHGSREKLDQHVSGSRHAIVDDPNAASAQST